MMIYKGGYIKISLATRLSILSFLFLPYWCLSQNLVKNPDFLINTNCALNFGSIGNARDWMTLRGTPDLFDSCATNNLYKIPINAGCGAQNAFRDNGVAAIVTFGTERESFFQTIRNLPLGQQLYARMMASPTKRCNQGITPSNQCFTDSQGIGIEYEDGKVSVIAEADRILDDPDKLYKVEGCYTPLGKETKLIINNFQADAFTKSNCLVSNNFNFGYTYIDNIVLAPFNPLPEKLVVCNNNTKYFEDLKFYDLSFRWTDGIEGSGRSFMETGQYYITAQTGKCLLKDSIYVVVLDDSDMLDSTLLKCENAAINLASIFREKVVWSTGDSVESIRVLNPGTYIAKSDTPCGVYYEQYKIIDKNCSKFIIAPNIMTKEKEATFYFETILPLAGKLFVYDRWGNLVHQQNANLEMKWDGKGLNGSSVPSGVYVWSYQDAKNKLFQNGDITILD
jgi:hypothetical protein